MKHKSILRKLIFSLALALGLGLGTAAVCSFAETVTVDEINYNLNDSTNPPTASVAENRRVSGSKTIPSTITVKGIDYTVTTIGYRAFFECDALTSVTIPKSVTSIEKEAFYSCGSLTTITIPKYVTTIASEVFGECTLLSSITVDGENDNFSSLDGVLYDKQKTKLIHYPSQKSNESFLVPNTVKSIETGAFDNCFHLINVNFEEGSQLNSIGVWAFVGCESLKTINFPEGVKSFGSESFMGCRSLEVVTIPASVEDLGGSEFSDCDELSNVYVKSSLNINSACIRGEANIWQYDLLEPASTSADGKTHVNITEVDIGEGVPTPVLLSPNAMGDGYVIDSLGENVPNEIVLIGDISGNKKIDILDLQMLYNQVAEISPLTTEQLQRAKITNDNEIDVLDLQALFNIIANS